MSSTLHFNNLFDAENYVIVHTLKNYWFWSDSKKNNN